MSTADELRAQAAALLTKAAELETPLSKEDVHKLFVEKRYSEIEAARQAGRITYQSESAPEGN